MLYFTLCDIIHPTTEVLDNELKSSQKKNDFPINFWFLILAHYFFCVFVCFSFHAYILSSVEENYFCLTLWGVTNGEGGEQGGERERTWPLNFWTKKRFHSFSFKHGDIAFHGSNFSFFSNYKGEFLKRSDTKSWTF